MSNLIQHIKKNESLSDKQLVVVNSAHKDNLTQNSSSFTYTFNEQLDRISRADIIYTKIPNTFYNVNNDNASMVIDTQTFTDNISETLIVDDIEIKNNIINATNIQDNSVIHTSLYNGGSVNITDIVVKNTFLYTTGSFSSGILDLYNSTNVSSENVLGGTGSSNLFVSKYTIDQLLLNRFKITGLQNNKLSKICVTSDSIFVSGIFNSFPVKFYNSDDTTDIGNDLSSNGNYSGLVTKYDLNGNFIWRLRVTGLNTSDDPLYISCDETNNFLYISGTYNSNLIFYDTTDISVNTLTAGVSQPIPSSFLAQYNFNGTLNWRSSMKGQCRTTSIITNPTTNTVTIALDFSSTLELFNSSDISNPVNDLISDGIVNISIVEYDQLGELVNRFKIGGSFIDNNAKLSIISDSINITGNYKSNPVKFYNTSDVFSLIEINISQLYNTFIVQYDSLTKTPQWSTYIESTGNVYNAYISSTDTNIYLAGVYDKLTKFNDINGDVTGQDLTNNTLSNFGFLVKYDVTGKFINRSFISSTVAGNISFSGLDATSNYTYIASSFTNSVIDLYNANNNINKSVTNLGEQNGIVVSYINNINNYTINRLVLNKTVITKSLTGIDLNHTLNLNAFSQSLGFTQSQKFRPIIFSNKTTWETKDINSTNNTLIIEFLIGNLETGMFDKIIETFVIDIFVEYTRYSLVYQLNKLIKNRLKKSNTFVYDQDFEPIVYDFKSNIFYIQFNINGTFIINPTVLSGVNYLEFLNTTSLHVCISDENIETAGDISITDNTKLTLKTTENTLNNRIIEGTFSETFPIISGGGNSLILSALPNNILSAQVSLITDNLNSDIQLNDEITFESPWLQKDISSVILTKKFWLSISMSSDGVVRTVITATDIYVSKDSGVSYVKKKHMIYGGFKVRISSDGIAQTVISTNGDTWVSIDSGDTWNLKQTIPLIVDLAMSSNGITQLVIALRDIWISNDTGDTWNILTTSPPTDPMVSAQHSWGCVAISGNGQVISVGSTWGDTKLIYTSNDVGITWETPTSPVFPWWRITMSYDGLFQTAIVQGGTIYTSNDSGVSWNQSIVTNQAGIIKTIASWKEVAMSSNGMFQAAVVSGGELYVSSDSGNTWNGQKIITTSTLWNDISISGSGLIITAVNEGDEIQVSNNFGVSWNTLSQNRNWKSVVISSDGTTQTAIIEGEQIYVSTNKGITWTVKESTRNWESVAISSDGTVQTAVVNNGKIYVSIDSGYTWLAKDSDRDWVSVSISADGIIQTAVIKGGQIYVSTDSGNTWLAKDSDRDWGSVSISSDGIKQTAVVKGGQIYVSTDSGNTWTPKASIEDWVSVSISANGIIQTAVVNNGQIYVSTDSGDNWNDKNSVRAWSDVSISANGIIQTAVVKGGQIYVSIDTGNNWTAKDSVRDWVSVSITADGVSQIAVVNGGQIYVSIDTGDNWFARNTFTYFNGISISSNGIIQTKVSALFTNIIPYIYVSYDSGNTWFIKDLGEHFRDVSISSDGSIQTAVANYGQIWLSTNSGVDWNLIPSSPLTFWDSISISADGKYQTAVGGSGSYHKIYISYDYGSTWSITGPFKRWSAVAISSDGKYQTAVVSNSGNIYISNNYGTSWTIKESVRWWRNVAMSGDGKYQTAVTRNNLIYVSNDSGDTWTAKESSRFWTDVAMSSDGLIQTAVVDGGQIYVSIDAGDTWTAKDYVELWTGIDMSADGKYQTAISKSVSLISIDFGNTWKQSYTVPETLIYNFWKSVAISSDGTAQTAVVNNGSIYVSTDSGDTWNDKGSVRAWSDVSISTDGIIQTAVVKGGQIYVSTDSGNTWTPKASIEDWVSISISSNGLKQTAVVEGGQIYVSTDSGDNWNDKNSVRAWSDVSISTDGLKQTAVVNGGQIYVSIDTGNNWTAKDSVRDWVSVSISANGIKQTAVVNGGQIYVSIDSGDNWTAKDSFRDWVSVSMAADGVSQIAVVNGGKIYVSIDSGNTWTARASNKTWSGVSISSDGSIQTAVVNDGKIHVHPFVVDRYITLNIQYINSSTSLFDTVLFRELTNNDTTLLSLNDFNMSHALNYTIKYTTTSVFDDIYVPPGNYTPVSLKDTINNIISGINTSFTNAFSYDTVTRLMSFTSIFGGNVIKSTNLLNQMGFTILPSVIDKDISIRGNSVVNTELSGPSNLFIKSDVLGNLRKNKTGFSSNKKLKNIIAPLSFDSITNTYQVNFPIELFFSKKSIIPFIDIQIVDESGNIVNLNMNQNNIEVVFYFYSS
jgi:hypothetical protein